MRDVALAEALQLVFLAVEHKACSFYPSDISAHGGSEVLLQGYVVVDVVETQHHVLHSPLSGSHQRDEPCAEVGDAGFHAVQVGNGVKGGLLAVDVCHESLR